MRMPASPTKKWTLLVLKVVFFFGLYFVLSLNFVPGYTTIKDFFQDTFMSNNRLLVVGTTVITAEVVDTPEDRHRGLSGRERLKPQSGMLFVFEEEGDYGIWMKDMLFPLDIIWINSHHEVVYFKENATPDSYPQTFQSPKLASYVLEVPAGFVKENLIKIGDIVDFK